jgi:hypothetical protein
LDFLKRKVIALSDIEKELQIESREIQDKPVKDLYGLEPEMSLQSVNFAPNENSLLNEHFEEVNKNND